MSKPESVLNELAVNGSSVPGTSSSSGTSQSTKSKKKAYRPRNKKKIPADQPTTSVSTPTDRVKKSSSRGNMNKSESSTNESIMNEPIQTEKIHKENKPKKINNLKNRPQGRLTMEDSKSARKMCYDKAKKIPKLPAGEHDMSTVIAYELNTSAYECMICMDTIRPAHPTWTCDCCWAIFHLNCIQTWANKSLKDTSLQKIITQWRCPGCQSASSVIPRDYVCFCGKQRNPDIPKYNTPHSCEQLCKRRKSCPHECVLLCHPGPCPPCSLMGPMISCYCGHHKRQLRCVDTDYSTKGYGCDDICDELLGCGKHRCTQKCHRGLCSACEVVEVQSCYCGRHERSARCGSGKQIQLRGHIGYYSCEENCDTVYACGYHRCQKACHPCSANLSSCPYDPAVINRCPCGAHSIQELLQEERQSCMDPVPTCDSICNKILPCGHHCTSQCHTGNCPACLVTVEVSCRCQSTLFKEVCSDVCEEAGGEAPLCKLVCKSLRNCGRHACGNVCCIAMKVKGKKKTGVEFAHDCPEICNRLLSCGKHHCQDKCHKGPCRPCLEASFEDVTCHCTRTRLEAPVRCGTKLPACPYPCQRVSPCGHIRFLNHNCHPDDEACPPCSVLVSRHCLCGKTELKNVPCYRESPRCGKPCEKPLECKHVCLKTCHSGLCLDEGETCNQICNTMKKCGHPCRKKCHMNTPCEDTTPCESLIKASCQCGLHTMDIACNATADHQGANTGIACNDYCAKVLRNRKLAQALDIHREDKGLLTESNVTSDDMGYYDDSLCEYYRDNVRWCRLIERTLIDFVNDPSMRVIHCKPMKSDYRRFIHRYAIHFNLFTEAVDAEPKRSVVIRKSTGHCRMPNIMLSKAAYTPSLNRPPVPEDIVKPTSKQPVNALYLSDIAFGMTQLELEALLTPLLKIGEDRIHFNIKWINDNDAVITPSINDSISMDEKEMIVWHIKKILKMELIKKDKASRVDCCWINQSGNITYNEKKIKEATVDDGWMHVTDNNPYKPISDAWYESPTTPMYDIKKTEDDSDVFE